MVVTTGSADNPTKTSAHNYPAGRWCSSYQAETVAMIEAIKIINANNTHTNTRIVTDSKSLVTNMKGTSSADPPKSSHAASLMLEMIESDRKGHNITIVWCPSHCGIVGSQCR